MKLSFDLKSSRAPQWQTCVLNVFNGVLQNHAECERNASTTAKCFVVKHSNREEIIPKFKETPVIELEHIQNVDQLMDKPSVAVPSKSQENPNINPLLTLSRSRGRERCVYELLTGSDIESRGADRIKMVADRSTCPSLKRRRIKHPANEAKHGHFNVKMTLNQYTEAEVYPQLAWCANKKPEKLPSLEIRPTLP